ncbi:hypothetical protein BDA99DRAFT_573425 [Phascolomyces articulosus]|uniref:Uncharacterized protein n=1 Tax=Phascolomyces articulosus TaxID=60185 RepID=A0AAD5JX56_9FUNG|nr:hypothetical protein BDA99DRAFT_573425 [Phascolomyces articulosus]
MCESKMLTAIITITNTTTTSGVIYYLFLCPIDPTRHFYFHMSHATMPFRGKLSGEERRQRMLEEREIEQDRRNVIIQEILTIIEDLNFNELRQLLYHLHHIQRETTGSSGISSICNYISTNDDYHNSTRHSRGSS